MKRCNECGRKKRLALFSKTPATKDGHENRCKSCKGKYDAKRFKSHDLKVVFSSRKLRVCKRCGKAWPQTKSFWNRSNGAKDGLNVSCKRCDNLSRHYGVDSLEIDELYKRQNGQCAICERPHSLRYLHVDHDHAIYLRKRDGLGTKELRRRSVRGLLCSPCNKSLGWYEIVNKFVKSKWKEVESYIKNPPAKFLWETING